MSTSSGRELARASTNVFANLLVAAVLIWNSLVSRSVSEPYLDEYFHVRQSLVYYEGKFSEWDEKITTPPGLYFLSYPWLHALRFLQIPGSVETKLRAFNGIALVLLHYTANDLIQSIQRFSREREGTQNSESNAGLPMTMSDQNAHAAMNIALLPTLFFFSGLYYTDVVSALLVLKAHVAFFRRKPLQMLFWSLTSLTLRQTNIFWTAIYLAALEMTRTLEINCEVMKEHSKNNSEAKEIDEVKGFDQVAQDSWHRGKLYDLKFELAGMEDYLKTTISLVLAMVANLKRIILPLAPHIIILLAFCSFVVVNGGVVLGDKSNHVASLHVPQMLYIWPYICFFSLPVIAASLVSKYSRNTLMMPIPDTVIALLAAAVFWIAVNTVIHPFILADNRHYTFYVFRILIRSSFVRFAAAPIYIMCGWMCIAVFEGRTSTILIWITVSTLSLVTAPLIEPRYFILPWIMWRVNVNSSSTFHFNSIGSKQSAIARFCDRFVRNSLWLETVWSIVINVLTGYIFLNWTFEWPQEPGSLMRFMW